MVVGESKRFDYTGDKQSIMLSPGIYKLECYGARGGNGYGNSSGGKGGYVSALLSVPFDKIIFIYVGQAGNDGNSRRTSFNGGGIGGYDTYGDTENGGSGGGATDFRLSENINSRIIVAGGGGGAGGWRSCNGQPGGPLIGSNNVLYQGSTGINNQSGGGGGGGGYYGGATRGSQYIDYNVGLGAYGGTNYISKYMIQIKNENGINNSNGYAIITMLEEIEINRQNSNLYRDSYPQETFDFNKLLEV